MMTEARSGREGRSSTSKEPYAAGAVTSRDGTTIGYRRIGRGPGVILVQGAMGTAANYDQLARALANDFTVYVPDRRGRGMSPREYDAGHSIEREVEDLEGLLSRSGARLVFGLSSGAIITLEAARALPSVRKAAVYEPPFYLEGVPLEEIARFNDEIRRGQLASALVTVSNIVRLAPGFLAVVPRPLLTLATRGFLRLDDRRGSGQYAPVRELLPAMRFDFKMVVDRGESNTSFKAVEAEILLLGGTKSPRYLKNALDALETILPRVQRTELEGVGHEAPWNADRGGSPEIVARSLRGFFMEGRA
ncbi:alpha/beta fold hydrolase [Sorangium sp. So ce128]|uniref:alpha/beta fold hydrolase n=1 Tax=Sorangium sp. So ce128 TaxID=3133281 RepID=UPI003F6247DF